MVRMTGLEPAVSWSQTRRDTKLRYIRIFNFFVLQKPVCFQLFGQSVCSVPTALTPSCGSQNSRLPFGRGILTATPFCPRCICRRQRSGTMPKPRALPSELHPDILFVWILYVICFENATAEKSMSGKKSSAKPI